MNFPVFQIPTVLSETVYFQRILQINLDHIAGFQDFIPDRIGSFDSLVFRVDFHVQIVICQVPPTPTRAVVPPQGILNGITRGLPGSEDSGSYQTQERSEERRVGKEGRSRSEAAQRR